MAAVTSLCELGHTRHETRIVHVTLDGPTKVRECPSFPDPVEFEMAIFRHELYGHHPGQYCPAIDDLSRSIDRNGVWEGCETRLAIDVLKSTDGWMVDFGAHIGWYSLLAGACGRKAFAVDMEAENLACLAASMDTNRWEYRALRATIGEHSPQFDLRRREDMSEEPVSLWKIDIEGSEIHALRGPLLGRARHILIEISPCFNDTYPDVLHRLLDTGYDLFEVPAKPGDKIRDAFDRDPWGTLRQFPVTEPEMYCASIEQENLWCILRD